jgi:hypothetical protein
MTELKKDVQKITPKNGGAYDDPQESVISKRMIMGKMGQTKTHTEYLAEKLKLN